MEQKLGMIKKNIKLLLEYDGTNYCGWQKQKNVTNTVQQILERSISKATGEQIDAIGCSRTDTGVHAKGYVVNFVTCSTIPPERFQYVINNRLPKDIIVLDSQEAPLDFHSRFSCTGKRYIYKLLNRRWDSPIMRNYAYHVRGHLDVEKMNQAAKFLVGKHDFSAFKNTGSVTHSTVRTINSIDVYKEKDIINISISGNGFLYNMVRIIVGSLLNVGMERKDVESVKRILESEDRKNAGKTAPSKGLYLDKVFY